MKPKCVVLPFIVGLMVIGLGITYNSDQQRRFGEVRVIELPPDVIVDEYNVPVITSGGDVGFVSSVMPGSLISFSTVSGKILASATFGEIAGRVSMVETDNRRLIALPASNDPDHGRAATVSIINATSPDRLERISLVELPAEAHLTPTSRALLTTDGRFGVIASSLNRPTLFAFSVESGKITSTLGLSGWPSEIALFDCKKQDVDCLVGILSVETDTLNIVKLNRVGRLSAVKSFSPNGMRFDFSNNMAFSADGQILYVAVRNGEHVFAIDTRNCNVLGMIRLSSPPQRVTAARDQTENDVIAVTRAETSPGGKAGGVTVLSSNKGQFTVKTEFTPPDNIQFSRASNVVFNTDASVAFVASRNGIIFAFNTKTGELESFKDIGTEVRSLTLNNSSRTLIGVRSTRKSDEIAIIGFDRAEPGELGAPANSGWSAPGIRMVKGDSHLRRITIEGANFARGAIVEFLKAGDVVFRQTPVILSNKRLTVTVPTKKIEALGKFDVRVVTADKALSKTDSIQRLARSRPSTDSSVVNGQAQLLSKSATVLNSVRTLAANDSLRVVVETDGKARFQDFTLSKPPRIVVDIVADGKAGVRNGFGNKTIPVDSGLAQRVRVGQPRPGVVRVVLDTKGSPSYRLNREGSSLIIEVSELHNR